MAMYRIKFEDMLFLRFAIDVSPEVTVELTAILLADRSRLVDARTGFGGMECVRNIKSSNPIQPISQRFVSHLSFIVEIVIQIKMISSQSLINKTIVRKLLTLSESMSHNYVIPPFVPVSLREAFHAHGIAIPQQIRNPNPRRLHRYPMGSCDGRTIEAAPVETVDYIIDQIRSMDEWDLNAKFITTPSSLSAKWVLNPRIVEIDYLLNGTPFNFRHCEVCGSVRVKSAMFFSSTESTSGGHPSSDGQASQYLIDVATRYGLYNSNILIKNARWYRKYDTNLAWLLIDTLVILIGENITNPDRQAVELSDTTDRFYVSNNVYRMRYCLHCGNSHKCPLVNLDSSSLSSLSSLSSSSESVGDQHINSWLDDANVTREWLINYIRGHSLSPTSPSPPEDGHSPSNELRDTNPHPEEGEISAVRRSGFAVSVFGRSSSALRGALPPDSGRSSFTERLCTTPEKSPESDDETHGLNRFCSTMSNVHGEYEAQRRRVDEYE